MKNKISIIITLCLWSYSSKAQIYFEVNAGINNGNIVSKINYTETKSGIGYIASANVNIPLVANLLIKSGLEYESVHYKFNYFRDFSSNNVIQKRTVNGKSYINYINIPVKLLYSVAAGKGYFNFGGGPYLGIGVSGKTKAYDKLETTTNGNTLVWEDNRNTKREFGSADTALKRTNVGIGANVSYILAKKVSFNLYSNIGLSDQDNTKGLSTKTITYGVTVGYVFGKE